MQHLIGTSLTKFMLVKWLNSRYLISHYGSNNLDPYGLQTFQSDLSFAYQADCYPEQKQRETITVNH